jgi:hypothetical protein
MLTDADRNGCLNAEPPQIRASCSRRKAIKAARHGVLPFKRQGEALNPNKITWLLICPLTIANARLIFLSN